jgi:PKD repeat protein
MKPLKWLLVLSLLTAPLLAEPTQGTAAGAGNTLKLKKNSAVMNFNGKELKAAQPVTIKGNSAYLPLNGIAVPFGFQLSFDAKTKEAVAKNAKQELRFKSGSSFIRVDGKLVQGPGPVYAQNNYMMVPIRMWSNLTGSNIVSSGADITITWSALPSANFEVLPIDIYATQTPVTYVDKASHPSGLRIVEERWEGKMDVFPTAGQHSVTRQVMDENGNWSEPYTIQVNVLPPNQPPIADFVTDKATYRIGEKITYFDRSTDDEQAIAETKWSGNSEAFFEAGDKYVTLEVKDKHGMAHSVTKPITITSEVLYTQDEFNRLYTPIGGEYRVNGGNILGYEYVPWNFVNERSQLVRSNSPEQLVETGISYDTVLSGKARFLLYNESSLNYNVKLYIIATNPHRTPVDVGVGAWGAGGPDPYSTNAGKAAAMRYMDALNKNTQPTYTTFAPGETRVILPEMSAVPLKPKQVFSAYADLYSDKTIRYRVVVVPEGQDPVAAITSNSIGVMDRDEKHVRGTFYYADRVIDLTDRQLGSKLQQLKLGDKTIDKYLDGIDENTGRVETNIGNFGVLYKMKLKVAPRTMIGLNARGGHYTGAFIVNGQLVEVTKGGALMTNSEVGVLHRSGNSEETVEISFVLASGSNLPVHMLFLPLPEERF